MKIQPDNYQADKFGKNLKNHKVEGRDSFMEKDEKRFDIMSGS